jgi:site-specific recombinase XerD
MKVTIPPSPNTGRAIDTAGPLASEILTFALTLRSEHKKPKTVRTYTEAAVWLAQRCKRTAWTEVTRNDVREHMAWLGEHYSPAYASNQHRALQQFFRFLADEGDIPASPMTGMKPPPVPEKLVPVLAKGELQKLLDTCRTKSFTDMRDRALIMMFWSSGARLAEIAGLSVSDIDLELCGAVVTGKGSKMRIIHFDSDTAVALSRYLKARSREPHGDCEQLWIGQRGPLLGNGVYQMLKRRAARVKVKDGEQRRPFNPHRFRHDFSHRWMAKGGSEPDLMTLNGWSSASMVRRYGASAAAQRAGDSCNRVMR